MKPQEEKQKFGEGQGATKKPRFKIEKLEERIAPRSPGSGAHRCRYYGGTWITGGGRPYCESYR